MPPVAPVDVEVPEWNTNEVFAIETTKIWRGDNLKASGPATWVECYDAETDFGEGTELVLGRIRCAPTAQDTIYVLGSALEPNETEPTALLLKSVTNGTTWVTLWIGNPGDAGTIPVTFEETEPIAANRPEYDGGGYLTGQASGVVWLRGTREGITWGYPSIVEGIYAITPESQRSVDDVRIQVRGFPLNVVWPPTTTCPCPDQDQEGRPAFWDETFEHYNCGVDIGGRLYEYTDLQGWTHNPEGVLDIVFYRCGGRGCPKLNCYNQYFWEWEVVYWDGPVGVPRAIDVARTNSNWVYVGLENRILKSEDGGYNWDEITGDHGANDIAVHPLLAGVAVYWSTEGDLNQIFADVVQAAPLLSENEPVNRPRRIAYDPQNGGKLWVLAAAESGGFDLKIRDLGAWTVQKEAVAGASGIIAYTGGEVLYLDIDGIWYSSNYGASWANKQGNWTSFSGPISVFKL